MEFLECFRVVGSSELGVYIVVERDFKIYVE